MNMNEDFELKPLEKSLPVLKKKTKMPENLMEAISQAVKGKIQKFAPHIVLGVVIVSASFVAYFWHETSALKKNPQRAAQQETQKLLANVSKLIVLPEGENPTIATVADPEKLKDQPFFARAKRGDRVLIYTNSKKAILYDEENNKIVEVAPINIGSTSNK